MSVHERGSILRIYSSSLKREPSIVLYHMYLVFFRQYIGQGRVPGSRQGLEGLYGKRYRQHQHRRAPRGPDRGIVHQTGAVPATRRSSKGSSQAPGLAHDDDRIVPPGLFVLLFLLIWLIFFALFWAAGGLAHYFKHKAITSHRQVN